MHPLPRSPLVHGLADRALIDIVEVALEGASINNSVLLTSLSLTGSNESSAEPRVVISNNDRSVKFFDVAVRTTSRHGAEKRLTLAGQLQLDVPVNHCEFVRSDVHSSNPY